MSNQIIMLSSITYAYKAEAWLAKQGIKAYVHRIQKHLRTHGCGYGLRVRASDAEQAAALLRSAGFPISEIIEL